MMISQHNYPAVDPCTPVMEEYGLTVRRADEKPNVIKAIGLAKKSMYNRSYKEKTDRFIMNMY